MTPTPLKKQVLFTCWLGICLLINTTAQAAETLSSDNTQHNPYGLDALWTQGDLVAKGTLMILLIMSIASWYMLFVKLLEQHRLFRCQQSVLNKFWLHSQTNQAPLSQLPTQTAYYYLAQAGMDAKQDYQGAIQEHVSLSTWIENNLTQAFDQIQARLQVGLALLGTVGSTAPFIGLFGTVWGIYHALTAIGIAGQASIDKVAGPVGEALIMTAMGLAVAVPAVLSYNWLLRRNKNAMTHLHGFANDLEKVLLGGNPPKINS